MGVTKTKKQTQELVPTDTNPGVPAFLQQAAAADAGKGVSTAAEDNLVPMLRVLQALSPQVNKRNPEYLDGAEPGDIWLRNSNSPPIKGEIGVLFQPCHFSRDYVEWVPRDAGGGFVGRHAELPPTAEEIKDPKNPNRVRFVLPNGNELIDTRYHVGYVIQPDGTAMPYVIPFASSGHTVSRGWMVLMNSKQLPSVGRAPAWAALYRLKTRERTNAAGTWFVIDVSDAGWVETQAEYERGKGLYESFESGEKQADVSGLEDDEQHATAQDSDTAAM